MGESGYLLCFNKEVQLVPPLLRKIRSHRW